MDLIEQRLGTENAARLRAKAGGLRLRVPLDLARSERFQRRLGRHLAILVILHFGGRELYVPNGRRQNVVDPSRIVALTARGQSAGEIARRVKCSNRTVRKHRNPTSKNCRSDGASST